MSAAAKARVYAGPDRLWILHVPGVAWGARATWRAAYDDADLLARTLGARPDRRIPGAALAALDLHFAESWPAADRRTPADECDACLTHTDDPPNR